MLFLNVSVLKPTLIGRTVEMWLPVVRYYIIEYAQCAAHRNKQTMNT